MTTILRIKGAAALLLVAAGATVTLNFVPSFGFPALSAGRWAIHSSTGARVFAHAVASLAACSQKWRAPTQSVSHGCSR